MTVIKVGDTVRRYTNVPCVVQEILQNGWFIGETEFGMRFALPTSDNWKVLPKTRKILVELEVENRLPKESELFLDGPSAISKAWQDFTYIAADVIISSKVVD